MFTSTIISCARGTTAFVWNDVQLFQLCCVVGYNYLLGNNEPDLLKSFLFTYDIQFHPSNLRNHQYHHRHLGRPRISCWHTWIGHFGRFPTELHLWGEWIRCDGKSQQCLKPNYFIPEDPQGNTACNSVSNFPISSREISRNYTHCTQDEQIQWHCLTVNSTTHTILHHYHWWFVRNPDYKITYKRCDYFHQNHLHSCPLCHTGASVGYRWSCCIWTLSLPDSLWTDRRRVFRLSHPHNHRLRHISTRGPRKSVEEI